MASLPAVSQRALERLDALRLSRASRQDMAEGLSNHEEDKNKRRRRRRARTRTHPLATRGVGPQTAVEVSTFNVEEEEVTGQFWPRGKLERIKLPSINPLASRGQAVKSVTHDRYMPAPLEDMATGTVFGSGSPSEASEQRRRLEERAGRVNAGRWRRDNLTYAFHRQPRPYLMAGSKLPLTRRSNMSEEELLRLKRMEATPAPELFFGRGMAADDEPTRMRQVQQAKRRASQLATEQLGADPMEVDENAERMTPDEEAEGADTSELPSPRRATRPLSPGTGNGGFPGLNGPPKRTSRRSLKRGSLLDGASAREIGDTAAAEEDDDDSDNVGTKVAGDAVSEDGAESPSAGGRGDVTGEVNSDDEGEGETRVDADAKNASEDEEGAAAGGEQGATEGTETDDAVLAEEGEDDVASEGEGEAAHAAEEEDDLAEAVDEEDENAGTDDDAENAGDAEEVEVEAEEGDDDEAAEETDVAADESDEDSDASN